MKAIYKSHLQLAREIDNNTEKLSYLTSVLRSLLQTAVVTTFEIVSAQTPADEFDLAELVERFRKPSDGIPLQILDSAVPFLRTYVSHSFLQGWFEPTKQTKVPLSKKLIEWVEFRNKRQGHGVLDASVATEWAKKTEELLSDCMLVLNAVIPSCDEDKLYLSEGLGNQQLRTPLLSGGSPIVITSISARKNIWKLRGQVLSLENAREVTFDLGEDSVFSISGLRSPSEYRLADVVSGNRSYSFFHNIPVRQTDTFEGRNQELNALAEWMDDEDSRYCLVYGDGGYGKTTLVLELLNQLLESQLELKRPLPTIISYHTAKMTKWTEEGLVHFRGLTPAMDECVREVVRCLDPILPAEWYSVSDRALVDKAVGVLRNNKFTRDDVLIVLDNTETLATTPQEVKDLGAFFKIVGKLVGRLIITSRRREFIEATPVLVEGLSEEEGVRLMRRLATDYKAKPILQAGEAKLRRVSNQLMRKPILLEALVKYISRSELGIDAAIENVFKKSNEELLEFLYEDAWARMSELQKELFLVIIHITCPLDQYSIGQACQEVGIQHSEFQSSLAETHFAVLTDYGKSYSLEMVDLAQRFFLQQFSKLDPEEKGRLKAYAENVDRYANEREKVEKAYKKDRVAEAFRSEYAKAAKVSVENGDIGSAIELYELAIEDDPLNAALHDRFSWLLLNRTQDHIYAKRMSEKAVSLDPANCDAVVGLALVNYRLGDIAKGDQYIDRAEKLGRSPSFCFLRKAIARFYLAKGKPVLDERIALLEDVVDKLQLAERHNARSGGYEEKTLKDIKKYQDMTRASLSVSRAIRTKLHTNVSQLKGHPPLS